MNCKELAAPAMRHPWKILGKKTLSSHAVQGSDGIAWGSALPRQRGFKGGSVGRHSGK
jgi:hypothetical protein